jgi:prepilin-type N-terminal cleavage/methylation domain-containing protein
MTLFTFSHQRGFTLIELLVAVTVMMLMLGGGVAGYSRLNRRQNLVNAGRETQLMMRAAQKKARVGERPAGCDKLLAYTVQVLSSDLTVLNLTANCESGNFPRSSYTTPSGITFASAINMKFQVLHGGVQGAKEVVLNSSTQEFSFDVDEGGQITEGVVE